MDKKHKLYSLWMVLLGILVVLGACASNGSDNDQQGGASGARAAIDCEQEANKYRKPCRDKRW